VRITSIGFSPKPAEQIFPLVDEEGQRGTDLIVLPETWTGQGTSPETLEGPTVTTLAHLARKHRTYIVCPLDRTDGKRRLNTAVLLDRQGKIVGVYDKVYPYWSEYDLAQPVTPGDRVSVFATDFGRVGMAICFDVNFPNVWQQLADAGAELVIWPSAYSAGTSLQSHALNHHFYIVTCTYTPDCQVYDITGARILDESHPDINFSRITLDLDRGIYHENFNTDKRDHLLAEHGADVALEQSLPREQWFVLKAKRPGVSARALARDYGLEELRDYTTRSRREIDRKRGHALA
jgi:predicted amidohydrolase